MKYYCGESEVIVTLRELFPDCNIVAKNGAVSVKYDKVWFTWEYGMLAPEQQLDTLAGYIEKHFRIKRLKCRNGKTEPKSA